MTFSFGGRENGRPIVLHARDRPTFRLRFVETLVELADLGLAVVGPIALGVGVVYVEAESRAAARSGPLEHLQVAIGVAESGDWSAADVTLNAYGFALLVVVED
jgi:hypothetical protein